MASSTRLLVGLGNPGPEYAYTRHNVGFRVVELLIKKLSLDLQNKGTYELACGSWRGRSVCIARPLTFMNRSGSVVDRLMRRVGVDPVEMLVILDDINLDPGMIRIRERGGSGGHNGLEDIIDALETNDFPRIRIGIGSEFERGRQADYVLESFSDEEVPILESAIDRACEAALTYVSDGVQTAMNRYSR